MEYRIINKSGFRVVGKITRVSMQGGENFRKIPQFWMECSHDGTVAKLSALSAQSRTIGDATLGICMDFAPDMSEFTYMIAAEQVGHDIPSGMVAKPIPESAWAVFTVIGELPNSIQDTWGRIHSEFFPAGRYEHAAAPDIEVYPSGDPTSSDYRCEVWIPVVEKLMQQM